MIPMSWNWKSAWKCRPRSSQPEPMENSSTKNASTAVSRIIIVDSRSPTTTIPKGAAQSPRR